MDTNTVVIAGRLTREPESRQAGEHTVVAFSIANNGFKERVSFIDVEAWGTLGGIVTKHVGKGQRVVVTGELKQESWEKDGQKRSKILVNARDVQIIDWSDEAQPVAAGGQTTTDDIPFMPV